MKESRSISRLRVVPTQEQGLDKAARIRGLTNAAVRHVRDDAHKDYYGKVPDAYKNQIVDMVVANATSLDDVLGESDLHQKFAESWAIRQEVGPAILKEEGFEDVEHLLYDPTHADFHRSTIAGISAKGTIFVVGTGALINSGKSEGAGMVWEPLPERTEEPEYVPTLLQQGATVVGKPERDKPLGIRYPKTQYGRDVIVEEEAAPLTGVFMRPGKVDLAPLKEAFEISNREVNRMLNKKD